MCAESGEVRQAEVFEDVLGAPPGVAMTWIVDVDTLEGACEIGAKASAAPGPGRAPLYMPIEVRQVMRGAPPAEA